MIRIQLATLALVMGLAACETTPPTRSALDTQIEAAATAQDAQASATTVDDIMALADAASETADAQQAAAASESEIVWRAVAANGYDAASLIGDMDRETFLALRADVFEETTRLDDLCTGSLPDTRLGYYCALGLMLRLTNESEIAVYNFEKAVAGGDVDAAMTAAELYRSDITSNWSRYAPRIAELSLSEQDTTPIRQRQLASACALHGAANSGSPPWIDRQIADGLTQSAAIAYLDAASAAAKAFALTPAGGACTSDAASLPCKAALERALGSQCQVLAGPGS